MPSSRTPESPDERPLSALPPVGARLIAFAAILVAGVFGGLIGYGFTDLQGTDVSSTASAIGALVGAVLAAGGTAIVAVLVLRAMGEWNHRSRQS
ncbi:MAG: hypothetical protein AB7L13_06920 [Acidimicrobiia bacterium]